MINLNCCKLFIFDLDLVLDLVLQSPTLYNFHTAYHKEQCPALLGRSKINDVSDTKYGGSSLEPHTQRHMPPTKGHWSPRQQCTPVATQSCR
jgi:hypothetical protein